MKCTKIILWCCMVFIISCTKPELPIPTPPSIQKIFSVKESKVVDGQDIHFDLPSDGVYTLTLIDKESGQVVSREKFVGKIGNNNRRIYTNSLQSQYLYLLLQDVIGNEVGKTTIITK